MKQTINKSLALTFTLLLGLQAPSSAWATVAAAVRAAKVAPAASGVAGVVLPQNALGLNPLTSPTINSFNTLPNLGAPSLAPLRQVQVLAEAAISPIAPIKEAVAAQAFTAPSQPAATAVAPLTQEQRRQSPVRAALHDTGLAAGKKKGLAASLGLRFDGAFAHAESGDAVPVEPARNKNAADEAEDMLRGDNKAELIMPGFYWGGLELNRLAAAEVDLDAEAQLRMDVYKALIRYALRPTNDAELEQKYRLELFSQNSDAANALAAGTDQSGSYYWWKMLESLTKELNVSVRSFEEPILNAFEIDDTNDIPQAVMQRAVDLGLHKMKFPAKYGGLDLHQREYVQILEVIAGISPSLVGQISAQNTIGTAPMTMFGTSEQQDKYLPRLTSGEGLVSFGLTEPLAGTDLDKLETTARLEDGQWKISGEKVFITGIMDAQMMYLVAGHTIVDGKDVGPTVFIVDDLGFKINEDWDTKKKKLVALADRGMRITPWTRDGLEFMMIKGTDQGFIQLKDFSVPVDNVLGPVGKDAKTGLDGKKVPLRSLNKGRAGFAYLGASADWFAQRQAEWAVDRLMFDMYAPKRDEAGRQGYMEFPATLIGRSQIKADVLQVVSKYTSALIDSNPNSSVAALSALIKVRASDWNWENALDALELGGGHALIRNAPGRVYQSVLDSWIARIVEGVNPAMSQFPHMMAGGKVMKAMGTFDGMLKAAWLQGLNLFVPFAVSSKGRLDWRQAKWVQKRTAEFAMRFGVTAMFLGILSFISHTISQGKLWKFVWPPALFAGIMKGSQIAFAPKQNTLIRAFEAQADILTVAMVSDELNRNTSLSTDERWRLEQALRVLRWQVRQNLRYMTPWGHPVENAQAAVGRKIVADEIAQPAMRENRVEQHLQFLRDTADDFYRRIEEGK
jgi:alkylation response protein AidB-like acyl-CoA dehydrogenase